VPYERRDPLRASCCRLNKVGECFEKPHSYPALRYHVFSDWRSRQQAVGSKQKAVGGREEEQSNSPFTIQHCSGPNACHLNPESRILTPVLPHLPPTTYHLPPTNYHSFQQLSRFKRVTTFIFYNIPALLLAVEDRSFVFIDIPASFLHFLKLLVLSFPAGGDILSATAMPAESLLRPACPKYGQ